MRDYEANLKRFSDMDDVEISKDDPDPRGWDVIGSDGRKIGEVKDLLVDTAAMKVRSLEVELEGSTFNWNDNRRVALPADGVRLDEDRDNVVLEGIGYDELGRMDPFAYPYGSGSRESDTSSSAAYGGTFDETRGLGTADERGWSGSDERGRAGAVESGITGDRLTRSEEEVEIGKRERQAGEVHVGKHVETERISQPVSKRRERVYVERRPVSGDTPRDATFDNEEIRVPVTEEEAFVDKRPVVKEELVVGKETVEDTETIETDVRKERFDIKDDDNLLDERGRRRKGGI